MAFQNDRNHSLRNCGQHSRGHSFLRENRAEDASGNMPAGTHGVANSEVSAIDSSPRRSESTQIDEDSAWMYRLAFPTPSQAPVHAATASHDKDEACATDAETASIATTQVDHDSISGLLSLPSNILQRILQVVGAHYFREDVGRLAVCRRWLTVGQMVLFQDLHLNPTRLERLFRGSSARLPVHMVKCVYFDLHGYWGFIATKGPHDYHAWPKQRRARQKWIEELNRNLGKFRVLMKRCPDLTGLSIQCRSELRPSVLTSVSASKKSLRQYLEPEKLLSLWQANTLSVLELDLSCMRSPLKVSYVSGTSDPTHLCPRIAPLFRQLVSLTFRAVEICAEVLPESNIEINPKLETISVELGRMIEADDGPSQWKDISQCPSSQIWSPTNNVRGKLEARLVQIARTVELPRQMWITYVVPGDKNIVKEAYDAVNQRRLVLNYQPRLWDVKSTSVPEKLIT